MRKLKFGFAGLGRIASSTHLPILKNFSEVEIIAGAERNAERGKRIQSLFGMRNIYSSYEEMYEKEKLDAVYVCLPVFLHHHACLKALERNIHVFCEKPMCISFGEAMEISSLAEKNNLVLMPGYKRRYAPTFRKAKELIGSGLIGKVIQAELSFMTPGPYISWDPKSEWYLDPRWFGVIYDTGCYLADLLFYLVPGEPLQVVAVASEGFTGYNTPTNLSCSFVLNGGIVGSMTMGWRASNDFFKISIHGTAGTVEVSRDTVHALNAGTDPMDRMKENIRDGVGELKSVLAKIRAKIADKDFYKEDIAQASYFIEAVRGRCQPPMTGREACRIHSFLEKVVKALNLMPLLMGTYGIRKW